MKELVCRKEEEEREDEGFSYGSVLETLSGLVLMLLLVVVVFILVLLMAEDGCDKDPCLNWADLND